MSQILFMPPLKKGAYCLATVCRSVCRPSVVRSISFDPFTWSIPNLVQGLPSMSRWSLLIFRSHVQRSRSSHSSQPTVFSTKHISSNFEFCTNGGIYVSETFLVVDRLHAQVFCKKQPFSKMYKLNAI